VGSCFGSFRPAYLRVVGNFRNTTLVLTASVSPGTGPNWLPRMMSGVPCAPLAHGGLVLARFWLLMVLVASGLLSILSAMTHDQAPSGAALNGAVVTLNAYSGRPEDGSQRRDSERRHQRVSTSSGYQIETGAILAAHLGTTSGAEGPRIDMAPAGPFPISLEAIPAIVSRPVVRAAAAMTTKQAVPKRTKTPQLAAHQDAGHGVDTNQLTVTGKALPVVHTPVEPSSSQTRRGTIPAERRQVRVKVARRKSVRSHVHESGQPKRPVARRVSGGVAAWSHVPRDGS
jgi:hypothetical protein